MVFGEIRLDALVRELPANVRQAKLDNHQSLDFPDMMQFESEFGQQIVVGPWLFTCPCRL